MANKYLIRAEYSGNVLVPVIADNEEEAFEKARECILGCEPDADGYELSDADIVDNIDLCECTVADEEENVPVPKVWDGYIHISGGFHVPIHGATKEEARENLEQFFCDGGKNAYGAPLFERDMLDKINDTFFDILGEI